MKLFVLAALVAVAAGARLDNLERAYLPPVNRPQAVNGFGSPGGVQNGNNGFGTAGIGQTAPIQGSEGSGGFVAATSNQYLPPDHGPSASNGFGNFAGSTFRPVSNFGLSPQGAQYNTQPQFASANSQYQAPLPSSSQTSSQIPPLQPFDEETGYHY